jgi:hypothetical protein
MRTLPGDYDILALESSGESRVAKKTTPTVDPEDQRSEGKSGAGQPGRSVVGVCVHAAFLPSFRTRWNGFRGFASSPLVWIPRLRFAPRGMTASGLRFARNDRTVVGVDSATALRSARNDGLWASLSAE